MLTVLNDAASWLQKRGIDQWPTSFDADGWRAQKLREQTRDGWVFVTYADDIPAATATFTTWADPDFEHAWPDGPRNALYLIRLAVTEEARRLQLGLGEMLIRHGCRLAMMGGHRYLRLDCAKHNPRLHTYYRARGFDPIGVVDLPHRRSGALYQWDSHLNPGEAHQ